MTKTIIVGTDTLCLMAKNLLNRGEINQEQYDEIVERNNKLSVMERDDFIITENEKSQ